MEQLQAIATQLKLNHTFLYQFAVVVIMFLVTKYVFYNVLQKVLDQRVESTTGLDGEADHLIAKAEKLKADFDKKMQSANQSSMEEISTKKSEITKNLNQEYKSQEEVVNKEVDEKTKAVLAEIAAQKESVLAESKSLAESLVNKFI